MQEIEWVECGRVGRAVGLCGECLVFWNGGECPVAVGGEIFFGTDDSHFKSYKVVALRKQGRSCVVRFEGIEDRDAAKVINGTFLYVPADRLEELSEGEYYSYQILGLDVMTEDGRLLGKVARIFTAGENDVYEILPEGGRRGDEILLSALNTVIRSIDLSTNRMTVRLMEGMENQK